MNKEYRHMLLAFEKAVIAIIFLCLFLAVATGGIIMVFKFGYWLADVEF